MADVFELTPFANSMSGDPLQKETAFLHNASGTDVFEHAFAIDAFQLKHFKSKLHHAPACLCAVTLIPAIRINEISDLRIAVFRKNRREPCVANVGTRIFHENPQLASSSFLATVIGEVDPPIDLGARIGMRNHQSSGSNLLAADDPEDIFRVFRAVGS